MFQPPYIKARLAPTRSPTQRVVSHAQKTRHLAGAGLFAPGTTNNSAPDDYTHFRYLA